MKLNKQKRTHFTAGQLLENSTADSTKALWKIEVKYAGKHPNHIHTARYPMTVREAATEALVLAFDISGHPVASLKVVS